MLATTTAATRRIVLLIALLTRFRKAILLLGLVRERTRETCQRVERVTCRIGRISQPT